MKEQRVKQILATVARIKPRTMTSADVLLVSVHPELRDRLKREAQENNLLMNLVTVAYVAKAWSEGLTIVDLEHKHIILARGEETTGISLDLPYALLTWFSGLSEGSSYPVSVLVSAFLRHAMSEYKLADVLPLAQALRDPKQDIKRSRKAEPTTRRGAVKMLTVRGDFDISPIIESQ